MEGQGRGDGRACPLHIISGYATAVMEFQQHNPLNHYNGQKGMPSPHATRG